MLGLGVFFRIIFKFGLVLGWLRVSVLLSIQIER